MCGQPVLLSALGHRVEIEHVRTHELDEHRIGREHLRNRLPIGPTQPLLQAHFRDLADQFLFPTFLLSVPLRQDLLISLWTFRTWAGQVFLSDLSAPNS